MCKSREQVCASSLSVDVSVDVLTKYLSLSSKRDIPASVLIRKQTVIIPPTSPQVPSSKFDLRSQHRLRQQHSTRQRINVTLHPQVSNSRRVVRICLSEFGGRGRAVQQGRPHAWRHVGLTCTMTRLAPFGRRMQYTLYPSQKADCRSLCNAPRPTRGRCSASVRWGCTMLHRAWASCCRGVICSC